MRYEATMLRKDGSTFPAQMDVVSVRDTHGTTLYRVATVQDITDRKQAEAGLQKRLKLQEQLERSRNMLQIVIDSVPIRIFWKDAELRYMGCNSLFARDAGFSHPSELYGKDDFAMAWKAQADLYGRDDRQVIESGVPRTNIIEPQTTADGSMTWLNTSKVPLVEPRRNRFWRAGHLRGRYRAKASGGAVAPTLSRCGTKSVKYHHHGSAR